MPNLPDTAPRRMLIAMAVGFVVALFLVFVFYHRVEKPAAEQRSSAPSVNTQG